MLLLSVIVYRLFIVIFYRRRAKRTVANSDDIVDENVEKIVAKRFNPRRRMHEYLVKWEVQTLQNTWEPASHLEHVPHLLDTFEKQLARQKETRAAMQAKQQVANQVTTKTIETNKTIDTIKKEVITVGAAKSMLKSAIENTNVSDSMNKAHLSSERPQRSSKTKAMDQVKQWVSAAAHTPSSVASLKSPVPTHTVETEKEWPNTAYTAISGIKRKLDDTLTNKNNTIPSITTSTFEDLEEDLIPSHTLKKMKYGNAVSVEVKTRQDNVSNHSILVYEHFPPFPYFTGDFLFHLHL